MLDQRDSLVGADDDCVIRFADEGVLPRHALVHCGRQPPVVVDLTGCGFTRVNGSIVSDAELYDGDIVFFGPHVVARFELRGVVRCDPHTRLRLAPEVAETLDATQCRVANLYAQGERVDAIAERTDLAPEVVEATLAALHERWATTDRAALIGELTRSGRSSRRPGR